MLVVSLGKLMMNMETEIKWAEVAHYYAAAGIEISLIPYTIDQFMTGVIEVNKGIYTSSAFYKGGDCAYKTGTGYSTADTGKYLPILRALEDMTLQEKMEIFALAGPSEKPHDWEFRINIIEEYSASELHWLIQRGFDVFGLIASGQAIRKEVTK